MDIRDLGWDAIDYVHLDQDRSQWRALVNMVMDLCSIIFWKILE
jgi:hypothetical protein